MMNSTFALIIFHLLALGLFASSAALSGGRVIFSCGQNMKNKLWKLAGLILKG